MAATDGLEQRRALPSVDALLRSRLLERAAHDYSRDVVVRLIRAALAEQRACATHGRSVAALEDIAESVFSRLKELTEPGVEIINATGVVLHTNLGRAPLSADAVKALSIGASYSDLEFDLRSGDRGSRYERVRSQFRALTAAEGAHVTVNNAAGVTLALAALARDRDVLVSRGQLVEIGGGFRVPEVLEQSGARLVEVGTTNRTSVADYEESISERTACILHVHTSNFKVVGFTETPPLQDLARLAHARGILLVDDNGSGSLLDTAEFGLPHEPTPMDSLGAGADLVAFSGDKLLGGPQSGIILGKAATVGRLARHPLARAFRPDKLVLAALAATLASYVRGTPTRSLPVWRMLAADVVDLKRRVTVWQKEARIRGLDASIIQGRSAVGGGSLPGETLPTWLIQLPSHIRSDALRQQDSHVVARTHSGTVLLDFRTVLEEQDESLLGAVLEAGIRIDH